MSVPGLSPARRIPNAEKRTTMHPQPLRKLELRGYRAFSGEPVRLPMEPGITGLLGLNNAGKSTLLRFFYEFQPLFSFMARPGDLLNILKGGRTVNPRLQTGEQAFSTLLDGDIELTLDFSVNPDSPEDPIWPSSAFVTHHRDGRTSVRFRLPDGTTVEGTSVTNISDPQRDSPLLLKMNGRAIDCRPLIRSAELLEQAMYVGPFRNVINVGADRSYFDIAIGDAFVQQFDEFKSGGNPEQNEAAQRAVRDIARIFEIGDLQVNPTPDRKSLQVLVDGKSFRLSELGGGMAHFLIVLLNVLIRRPTLLLIDEPELNLHASLQLDFLTTMATEASHGVIFATHSPGLARAGADRIFVVAKDEQGFAELSPWEKHPSLSALLGQMGFGVSPEIGFEQVLLVEGRHDVKVFQQLLRLWGKDHKVLVLPLGGASMINAKAEDELRELTRITTRIASVIDSERTVADEGLTAEREGFRQACGNVGIACHVLDRRSTESYFTDRAVKHVYGESGRPPEPFEAVDALPFWRKDRNWLVARALQKGDLDGTDLGAFLEGL